MLDLDRKKLVMNIIVFCCLIVGLQIVASEGSSNCMADCTSLLTPRPPSLYEQYCCIPSNSGKKFKLKESNGVKFILCPPSVPTSCIKHTFLYNSCVALLQAFPIATSGYYSLTLYNGSIVNVYCDMEGSNCDGKGGWMRVGYLNMSEPNATCPPGLTLRQYNNIDHGVCGVSNYSTFASISFLSGGNNYSEVCGQIRGYQYKSPDGFPPVFRSKANLTIENCNTYVDGITITYGSNPRKHIWTYACGLNEGFINFNGILTLLCPCNNISTGTIVPSFVGSDHYCESGLPAGQFWQSVLYSSDPLWDGQQCNGNEGPCCTNPKMPWFIKTLNETTTEDIELRVCASQGYNDEDIPLDIIELYVR